MSNITYFVKTLLELKETKEIGPRIMLFEISKEKGFPQDFYKTYHTHLFCHQGSISFLFNDQKMNCKGNEFLFWFAESQLKDLAFSKAFKATVLLVAKDFLNDNIPDQSWSIDASLHSRQYPVKQLNEKKDRQRVLTNFQLLNDKFQDQEHHFYEEALKLQMRLFILEMWHTFAKVYERRKRSLQTGTLYERFMHLLPEYCLKEREVQFYASQLNITAKYLNVVSKQNSGVTASDWIQRYVRERIIILLKEKQLNITEITYKMDFSSRSFFTRYVKKVLGVTPSEFRNRLR
ncbi:helix-turn-helix domain-containing protein [Algoriphagus aquimarinus]|uniref:helix-turn-helix domain-containing protein n=1 Tax=Algoriphagus aquimarinus TaxID=237018 RepID=UPI0030DD081C